MSIPSRLIQVTNVSTSATKEQFRAFFAHLGRIDEVQLYPDSETLTATVAAKVGYVRYDRPDIAAAALNLTSTIFLDRPVICSLVRPSTTSSSSSSSSSSSLSSALLSSSGLSLSSSSLLAMRIPDETEAIKLCPTINSSVNLIPGLINIYLHFVLNFWFLF